MNELMSGKSIGASVPNPEGRARGFRNAARGEWGEAVAARYFEKRGWRVMDRRVRPCMRDRRFEIDLIVRSDDGVAFVEVKTHATRPANVSPLWRVDGRKKRALLRACASWILRQKWRGNFRFDVVEIYGSRAGPCPPEIEHYENVPLFPPKWRFW